MMDSACDQPLCLVGMLCPCCCAFATRMKVLDGEMTKYRCCQGYADCLCFKAGNCCETICPYPCLCLESFLCIGPSVSSSRIYVMDQFELTSDPCDRRLIRFNNCLQMLSCICNILAIIDNSFRELAAIIQCIADVVFLMTVGCQVAQTRREVDYQKEKGNRGKYQAEYVPPTIAQPVK